MSGVVTTLNNAATLDDCLASLQACCDELVVLDSGSSDATCDIARRYGARVVVEPFKGYSAQKQSAIGHATHDWILLLDSDEALAGGAAEEIKRVLAAPACVGYRLRRREWLFWRWQSPSARHNRYVRLFDRRRARMSGQHVHESVVAEGNTADLDALILHRGDRDIASKVDKANRYSTLQVMDRRGRRPALLGVRLVLYPTIAFLRYYVLRAHFRAGWAGYTAARIHAFYAFMKYAKLYEETCRDDRLDQDA